ncbi:AraC family transcriptional regulator [Lutibacter sp. B1]|uniref:helix-turn-helix domain-containing protein n=1 Tax=Lutibacter sp. B1 TaxID=2725996 RepID=UPI001456D4C8|nr:AraC family transcriptional regulator [Lutibacter sp. B1]NLP58656.1 helix-turn-helix transcriptional regulator [Lutibacter sp. B1]
MKLYLNYDINVVYKAVLKEQLDKTDIQYELNGIGEVNLLKNIDSNELKTLSDQLEKYGITIIEDYKSQLVQRIKDSVTEMIYNEEYEEKSYKVSVYLSEKLNYSYTYLSNLFSEVTYTSIENFIILKRIDYVKSLIINDELTLTEIAYKLNYSSVAHLSAQFKKTTGLTPTVFQKIITRRKKE